MASYYRNETLFSEVYLEEITRQPEQQEVLASLKVLREYRDYADATSLSAWTRSYVNEVLAALGFSVRMEQPALSLLYPMGSQNEPVALCWATTPGESLDSARMGRNWSEKTIRALRDHQMQWGLLTNGKLWRICHLDEATPYETYLEMDLESILDDGAGDAYRVFHKFMKASNFVVADDGKCQFARFKQESKDKIDYIEKELANALKQREEGGKGVLSDLCMGYVEALRHLPRVDLDDEALRRKVYHGAMLYMFRLLFLFYADARGLLSDANHTLLAEVEGDAHAQHHGETNGAGSKRLWERLSGIFVDIDQTYNGGLFSPQESEATRFIEETRLEDRYLAEPLHNLTTYRERNGEERPISYRDMGVRHLGTLYEGLLEHRLFIAQEPTEVRVTKGRIAFVPASQGGKLVTGRTLGAGEVYFGSDPSERKASGSYFTPEDVVDYIVRNTVGEKLEELKAEFLERERASLEALKHAVNAEEHTALAGLLEESALGFVRECVLTLSVLDPAMGSGHFLVNATNLIAGTITEFLNELGIEGETPTGTTYWRRWVVENCIYGVDMNPLAVELAKLSLWILSMAKDQPLSFMNHHLKCGNSLVGARLDDVGVYPVSPNRAGTHQLALFDLDQEFRTAVESAIAKAQQIAEKGSLSLGDVTEKKAWLDDMERALRVFKLICNVHTKLQLGSSLGEEEYATLIGQKSLVALAKYESQTLFHWELEFPDILIKGDGFDIILGNPPYADIPPEFLGYCERVYRSSRSGDLYTMFIELAVRLNRQGGHCGLVLPLSLTFSGSMQPIREELLVVPNKDWKIASFDRIPDALFGGDVRTRNSILIGAPNSSRRTRLLMTPMYRWFARDRAQLFASIQHVDTSEISRSGNGWAKIGSDRQTRVLSTLFGKNAPLSAAFSRSHTEHVLFYSSTAYNWLTATRKMPPVYDSDGRLLKQTKYGSLYFDTEEDAWFCLSILTSTFSYWYWLAYGDGFDVTKKLLGSIPLAPARFSRDAYMELVSLGTEIQADMEEHVVYKWNAGKRVGNYNLRLCRHITDRADEVIFASMGFPDEYMKDVMDFCARMIKTDLPVE